MSSRDHNDMHVINGDYPVYDPLVAPTSKIREGSMIKESNDNVRIKVDIDGNWTRTHLGFDERRNAIVLLPAGIQTDAEITRWVNENMESIWRNR